MLLVFEPAAAKDTIKLEIVEEVEVRCLGPAV